MDAGRLNQSGIVGGEKKRYFEAILGGGDLPGYF